MKRYFALITLFAFSLAHAAEGDAASTGRWKAVANENWKAVEFGDIQVKPGTALDLSALVESGVAGQHGFARINPKGELVFEKQPDKPLRLYVASAGMEYFEPKTPEEIEAYAEQARLAGYNLVRPHFLDHMLMIETTEDLVLNPRELDRWDRLSAALKKRGIYLYFDITTSWAPFYAMPRKGYNWAKEGYVRKFKSRTTWDPAAQEHWKRATKQLLEHVNPYTGVALKDEPQVVFFQLRNEASFQFLMDTSAQGDTLPQELLSPLRQWLQKKYGTIDALLKAWAGDPLIAGKTIKEFSDIPYPTGKGMSPSSTDLWRFLTGLEVETYQWMNAYMRQLGARVPGLDLNVGVAFALNLSRSALPIVDSHAYHDHPTTYISPGSTETNESPAAKNIDHFTWLNEVRQLDRPLVISEWGNPYWNSWRHEAGLGVPAYASLQGWQMICHHAEPIALKISIPLRPFKIAYDLPNKAGEYMGALLYARGDVAASTHTVQITLDPEGVFTRWGGSGYMPPALRRLSLLTRCGLLVESFSSTLPGAPVKPDMTLRIAPDSRNLIITAPADSATKTTPDSDTLNAALRKNGILSAKNRSDASSGIYESDTGQLLLNIPKKLITIDTPLSQGACLNTGVAPVTLGDWSFTNHGAPVTAFASSLDRQPFATSKRMLLIAVGDALNTGATFESESRLKLVELGTLPVLAQVLDVEFTLERPDATGLKLWALGFDGTRREEIPFQAKNGKLTARIKTGTLKNGPTPYFELVKE